jgi:Helix-turn-helix domain
VIFASAFSTRSLISVSSSIAARSWMFINIFHLPTPCQEVGKLARSDLTYPESTRYKSIMNVANMTQKQRVLGRLKEGTWLPMPETLHWSPPITRLGARIWDLRDEGYEIEERRVAGRNYSEYRLRPARKIELPPAYKEKPKEINQTLFAR